MEESRPLPPHIAILSSLGMGHLIPLAELSRRLVLHHGFSVTLITHSTGHSDAHQTITTALPPQVTVVTIPPAPMNTPQDAQAETRIIQSVHSNLSRHRAMLEPLASSGRLAALITDIFSLDAFDIAADLGVPAYIFLTVNCLSLSFGFHLPTLDASFTGEYRDLPEPVRFPGCPPVHGRDFPDLVHERGNQAYTFFLQITIRLAKAKAILVNSFQELESGACRGLSENPNAPPVYPVGPVVWTGPTATGDRNSCLSWLDKQPPRSVLYVSFGSGGTLTREQIKELACGLEMSGRGFVWVAKAPDEGDTRAAFFSGDHDQNLDFLPEGFLQRTSGRGLVVPSWAPQTEVLGNASTGGFLTHCGWNSTLESMMQGVPLIAWPLYAEQRMNAVMLVEDAGVALRVSPGDDGLVGREEISRVVKSLMEGEEGKRVRRRMEEVRDEAVRALGEGGSSFKAMAKVAEEWRKHGGGGGGESVGSSATTTMA